jgi:hypothetical protein
MAQERTARTGAELWIAVDGMGRGKERLQRDVQAVSMRARKGRRAREWSANGG